LFPEWAQLFDQTANWLRVADPRTLQGCGDPRTLFLKRVRGVAPPTNFSQIAFGAGRAAKIGEGSTPTIGEEHEQAVQAVLDASEMSNESNSYETATVSSPSGARSRPMPDAAPLPLPLPLPEIADGVAAAFPLDGPIGLRLHRAVTALIRDHHLVAVSNRTHPKNVFVRPSWPELHRSSPHCPRPLKPDASRAMYARRVTSWVCLGRQR
jgi:hypothetical protein